MWWIWQRQVIEYTEFLAAAMERKLYIQRDVCWNAFQVFDLNSDGVITKEELHKVRHCSASLVWVGYELRNELQSFQGSSSGSRAEGLARCIRPTVRSDCTWFHVKSLHARSPS